MGWKKNKKDIGKNQGLSRNRYGKFVAEKRAQWSVTVNNDPKE